VARHGEPLDVLHAAVKRALDFGLDKVPFCEQRHVFGDNFIGVLSSTF